MNLLEAIVLGIVQGVTEWLPISSTAHLKIVPALLHWPVPDAASTAVMQLGTLVSVLIFYWTDIRDTLLGMVKAYGKNGDRNSFEARLGLAVAVGTVPIIIAAFPLKKLIEHQFRNMYVIAGTMIVMAIVLYAAEKLTEKKRPLNSVTVKDGVIVGLAQCLALVPGSSRSGSTLIGAYLTKMDREASVRFSFLLSIPAVLLSGLYELKDVIKPPKVEEVAGAAPQLHMSGVELIVATVVSGIVGYITIKWLVGYLQRHSTLVFVIYRIALGLLLFYLLSAHMIAA